MASTTDLSYRTSTPDVVKTSLSTIRFDNGIPSPESAATVYDRLDHHHAVAAYLNSLAAVSLWAMREAFLAAGVGDNDVLLFSELIDSTSLLLTADGDTITYVAFVDLSEGPVVIETPPGSIGVIDDMWGRWITDFGQPGPDRGSGGTYLLLPPGHTGPVPEGGMFIRRSRTTRVLLVGRRFVDHDDPVGGVAQIRRTLKLYPYVAGGFGSSIAGFLAGEGPLAEPGPAVAPRFVEGSGRVLNTLPPNDDRFWSMLDEAVQAEPAGALDPETAGPLREIGIVPGERFQPNRRMRAILADALATGNACARTITVRPRPREGFHVYPDSGSQWVSPLLAGGHDFTAPPPPITAEGPRAAPESGARRLNARASFFYLATGISPSRCMNLSGVGSQDLGVFFDANGIRFDGNRTYRLVLPAPVPAGRLWSLTLYDTQTRSMLATSQRIPRAGSQAYPGPAAEPDEDGAVTLYISPRLPHGVAEGNWIQTRPDQGWFGVLRLWNPLPPFFDRSWRPSEIDAIA